MVEIFLFIRGETKIRCYLRESVVGKSQNHQHYHWMATVIRDNQPGIGVLCQQKTTSKVNCPSVHWSVNVKSMIVMQNCKVYDSGGCEKAFCKGLLFCQLSLDQALLTHDFCGLLLLDRFSLGVWKGGFWPPVPRYLFGAKEILLVEFNLPETNIFAPENGPPRNKRRLLLETIIF